MKLAILFLCCLMPFLVLLSAHDVKKAAVAKRLRNRNKAPGDGNMVGMIREFIGKKCEIHTLETVHVGIVESVEENWIALQDNEGTPRELVNLEYVTGIRLCKEKRSRKERAAGRA